MTRIEDLFISSANDGSAQPISWDALREPDALQEASLLDCRVCPLTGRAGLLLDMRTALQYRTGNAALLIVRGLRSFQWSEEAFERELLPFAVMTSAPTVAKRMWRMDLGLFPDGELSVEGKAADFFLLDAHGIPEAPPSYSDHHLAQVKSDLPWWESACTVLESSSTSSA
ncbi:hypothetical protein [Streptomyces bauhiniae]|uniref:hypothetical protein n=1 Tax=Streptomyces bauhiniae TaxID=2340725 RepID=UPI00364E7178